MTTEVEGRIQPGAQVCSLVFTTSQWHPDHVLLVVLHGAQTVPWWLDRDALMRGLDVPTRTEDDGGVVTVFPPLTRRHRYVEIVLDNEIEDAIAVEVERDSLAAALHATTRQTVITAPGKKVRR